MPWACSIGCESSTYEAGPLIWQALKLGAHVYCETRYFLNPLKRNGKEFSFSLKHVVKEGGKTGTEPLQKRADDVKQKINDFLNRKDYDLIAIETVKEHIHLHHEKLLNFFLREHMFCIIIYYRKEERKFDFCNGGN